MVGKNLDPECWKPCFHAGVPKAAKRHPLRVVFLPSLKFTPGGRTESDGYEQFSAETEAAAREAGVAFLDARFALADAYKKSGQPPLGFDFTTIGSGHLNEQGHLALARALEPSGSARRHRAMILTLRFCYFWSRLCGPADHPELDVARRWILVAASFFFYGYWNAWYLLLMGAVILWSLAAGNTDFVCSFTTHETRLCRGGRHTFSARPRDLQICRILLGEYPAAYRRKCTRNSCDIVLPIGIFVFIRFIRSATMWTCIAGKCARQVAARLRTLHRILSPTRRRSDRARIAVPAATGSARDASPFRALPTVDDYFSRVRCRSSCLQTS